MTPTPDPSPEREGLLPCPLCGDVEYLSVDESMGWRWEVTCSDPFSQQPHKVVTYGRSRGEAIAAWNTRASTHPGRPTREGVAPRATQFIGWIADRFIEKHITPLEREKAIAMAWATLEFTESQCAAFGNPEYGWTQDDAIALADEEIETTWESAS